jgi:hypothetical protein
VDFVSYHVYLTGQSSIDAGMTWAQLYGYTQSTTSGIAQYYTRVAALTTKPIYLTEYNDNWAFAVDCCRNDPTYGPLWNALAIVDHLNASYTAKSVPAQLVYFNATSSKYFCVLGVVDTAMDCATGSDPYPQFYALKLFSSTLGLHDGGNMAASVTATGLVATAFYTRDADAVVLINPTSPALTVTVALNHPGFVSATATSYLLAGGQITSTPLALQSVGSNYTAQVSLPAYSTLAIAMTGSTQIALPPSALKAQVV